MDPAAIGVLGTLGGAVVGGAVSYVIAVQASKDETKRLTASINAERNKLVEQREHESGLEYRADLRVTLDGCIDAAVTVIEKYGQVHALMDMKSRGLIDETSHVVAEEIPGHLHPGKIVSDFLDAWTRWKAARSRLWSRLPEESPIKAGTARFDLALHTFHQGTTGVKYSDGFGGEEAEKVAIELRDAVSEIEDAAYLVVGP